MSDSSNGKIHSEAEFTALMLDRLKGASALPDTSPSSMSIPTDIQQAVIEGDVARLNGLMAERWFVSRYGSLSSLSRLLNGAVLWAQRAEASLSPAQKVELWQGIQSLSALLQTVLSQELVLDAKIHTAIDGAQHSVCDAQQALEAHKALSVAE